MKSSSQSANGNTTSYASNTESSDLDFPCCVCSEGTGWLDNPIVYCDGPGCNVAVHQACYGISRVPKGNWYCNKCKAVGSASVRCELCPFTDGAYKETDDGKWAHVVCGLYIPEAAFKDVTKMEPIVLSEVPPERFFKMCYICERNERHVLSTLGACAQCKGLGCKRFFHITCAQPLGLLCEEAGDDENNVSYCGYCEEHHRQRKTSSAENDLVGGSRKEKISNYSSSATVMNVDSALNLSTSIMKQISRESTAVSKDSSYQNATACTTTSSDNEPSCLAQGERITNPITTSSFGEALVSLPSASGYSVVNISNVFSKNQLKDDDDLAAAIESGICKAEPLLFPSDIKIESDDTSVTVKEEKDAASFAANIQPKSLDSKRDPGKVEMSNWMQNLLEEQWKQGSRFLMEQAEHLNVSSTLSELHQVRTEIIEAEETYRNMVQRRDHLIAINAKLSVPLSFHKTDSPT